MIVYIKKTLNFIESLDTSSTEAQRIATSEDCVELSNLCKSYSVAHTLTQKDGSILFSIAPQKITLDEVAMNDLFCNVLNLYFEIDIRYMALGGKGCEMAFVLTPTKVVYHSTLLNSVLLSTRDTWNDFTEDLKQRCITHNKTLVTLRDGSVAYVGYFPADAAEDTSEGFRDVHSQSSRRWSLNGASYTSRDWDFIQLEAS